MGVVAVSQKEGALTHVLAHDLQIACCSRIRSPCRNSARGLSGAWGDEVSGSFVPLGMDMTPCNPSRPAECAGAPGVIQAQNAGRTGRRAARDASRRAAGARFSIPP